MKSVRLLVFCMLIVFAAFTGAVFAQDAGEACEVSYLFNSWARPTVAAAPNGAVYGQLVNIGDMPDTLVSATTDVAASVEFHEMRLGDGDVMQMRPVEGGLVVAANSFLTFEPGGLHLMLLGLTDTLNEGDYLELTLTFERAGDVMVSVPIADIDMMDMGMSDDGEMDMSEDSAMDMDEDMPMMIWDEACASVHAVSPWVRPSIPGVGNSAGYAMLVNLTDADAVLIGVTSPGAEIVELHNMTMGEGDVMQMRPVEGGIEIPAGGATLLQPGGLHMMMLNITDELEMGEEVEFSLEFASGDTMTISAPVIDPAMDMD